MFERPYFQIWQHTPFGPSSPIRDFVEMFVVDGWFDAQRFWEHVAKSLAEHDAAHAKGSQARSASVASQN